MEFITVPQRLCILIGLSLFFSKTKMYKAVFTTFFYGLSMHTAAGHHLEALSIFEVHIAEQGYKKEMKRVQRPLKELLLWKTLRFFLQTENF